MTPDEIAAWSPAQAKQAEEPIVFTRADADTLCRLVFRRRGVRELREAHSRRWFGG